MPSVPFENWWAEFQRTSDALADPQESARRIGRHLRSLDQARQSGFVGELMEVLLKRQHSYGVALFMLEQITDPGILVVIARHLHPLPGLQSEDQEGHLADLIRILASADDPKLTPVVRAYLLERQIGPHWSSVPWALWPHCKDLFAAAWSRFFQHQHLSIAEGTLVMRSFLSEPEAIQVVRRTLARSFPDRWDDLRGDLLRQAGSVRWLDAEQRTALQKSLE